MSGGTVGGWMETIQVFEQSHSISYCTLQVGKKTELKQVPLTGSALTNMHFAACHAEQSCTYADKYL